jgi:hypothetical protein
VEVIQPRLTTVSEFWELAPSFKSWKSTVKLNELNDVKKKIKNMRCFT